MPKVSAAHREARRQRILDAAQLCFSREGFHQTSMADIVRQSGVSHGAIYLYFQNKDDIIEALADDRHRYETLLFATSAAAGDPVAGLRSVVRSFAAALSEPGYEAARRVGVQGWAEALRNPRVHATVVEGLEIARTSIVSLVQDGQRQGRLRADLNPDAIARVLIALYEGMILQVAWNQPLDGEGCLDVVDQMLQALLGPNPAGSVPSSPPSVVPFSKGKE